MSTRLFIVGAGRSGTSLLQAILSTHHNIYFFPETGILRRYVLSQKLDSLFANHNIDGLVSTLLGDSRISRLSLTNHQILMCVKNSLYTSNPPISLYNSLLSAHLNSFEALYYGDKDPRLLESLDMLFKNFQGCKVIHIERNCFDVVSSRMNAQWSENYSFMRHLAVVLYQSRLPLDNSCSEFSNYISVRYEDLLNVPLKTLNRILDFLELAPFDSLPNHTLESKRLVAHDEIQWKTKTLTPLDSSNVNKWFSTLSSYQVSLLYLLTSDNPCLTYGVDMFKVRSIFQSMNYFYKVIIFLHAFGLRLLLSFAILCRSLYDFK